MDKSEIVRQEILELCSEDDYGVWELFWNVSSTLEDKAQKESNQPGNAKSSFAQLIGDLVRDRKITAKRKNHTTGKLEVANLDVKILKIQIENSAKPDPDSFYWFGIK